MPLRIVERAAAEQALTDIARAEQVERIVLGLPLSLDGSIGAQARAVQVFGESLARATGLPIDYWDERLTSVQAERAGAGKHAPRRPARRRRERTDDVAAAIILQGYLDRHRGQRERTDA